MKVLEIKQDDFVNFRDPLGYPSLFIGMGSCDWKCCVEAGIDTSVCQNYELTHSTPTNIEAWALLQAHMGTARSVVVGGLEPLNDMDGLLELANAFSKYAERQLSTVYAMGVAHPSGKTGFPKIFVLYTGYNADEVSHEILDIRETLGPDVAFIVKYGRFVPNDTGRHDTVLGVELASSNQYATVICNGSPSLYDQMSSYATVDPLNGCIPQPAPICETETQKNEAVDHPQHYKSGGIEAIDVIRAFNLNFSLGNAVKYILRAGRKDKGKELEDLKKALWYLDEEIKWRTPVECAKLESGDAKSPTGS